MSQTSTSSVSILKCKALQKPGSSLLGFVEARLASGMVISDITVHRKGEKLWASPPSKPMIGSDGTVMRDQSSGKLRYTPVISFSDDKTRWRWSDSVVAAVREQHPEMLSDGEAQNRSPWE